MDYIQGAFARMNLSQINNFFLYGADELSYVQRSYKDRLKGQTDPIYNRLRELYPDEAEREKAEADLAKALTAYEHVCMELGMKAGRGYSINYCFWMNDCVKAVTARQ